MPNRKRVLFLCVGNSCRSQMAEGLLRNIAPDDFEVHSAGANPVGLNRNAVVAMADCGIDISGHRSKSVEEYRDQVLDFVITVCDSAGNASCPVFLGEAGQSLNWPFDDPADAEGTEEEVVAVFKRARDSIRKRLELFVEEQS